MITTRTSIDSGDSTVEPAHMSHPVPGDGRADGPASAPRRPRTPTLVVDLDGTLLRGDLLWEGLRSYLFSSPWRIFQVATWWFKEGRAGLKYHLAERVRIDGQLLPWNNDTIAFCQERAARGVEIVIATASNQRLAESVTKHFSFITRVQGSDRVSNLKGELKASRLAADFGQSGFDYVGDSSADLPVWLGSRQSWFVGSPRRGATLQRQLGKTLSVISKPEPSFWQSWWAALRPHQWLKNLLVFFPLLAAHRWTDAISWRQSVPAFAALCCMASAAYFLNDLADVEADRQHPRKRSRPFASGKLGIPAGCIGVAALFVFGLSLAWTSGPAALIAILGYFSLSAIYTLGLKTIPILDAIFLSGLYTYRMVVGGVASSVMISPWLLAFSTAFFLGLAFLKRFVELDAIALDDPRPISRRGYRQTDVTFVLVAGVASSFLSVVVLALYLESTTSRTLYTSPQWLWGIALVMLFWIIRVWFLASRKQMHDDPVWFAANDWVTFGLAAACLAFIAAARPI